MRIEFLHLCRKVLLVCLLVSSSACSKKNETSSVSVEPASIDFGSSASSAELTIAGNNQLTVPWSINIDQPWLSVSKDKGLAANSAENIQVYVDRANLLPGQKKATITLSFSGKNLVVPVSVLVVNQVPVAKIMLPRSDTRYLISEPVVFSGAGIDQEEGELGGASLVWHSDRDGKLGEGNIIIKSLSEGRHRISLSVSDNEKTTETVSVNLVVSNNDQAADVLLKKLASTRIKNTTRPGFIDGGVATTESDSVTLKISAEDAVGVVAYYVNDSKIKFNNVEKQQDWNWTKIDSSLAYKAIVTYRFNRKYSYGENVYINVWFKSADERVSEVVQDSILYEPVASQHVSAPAVEKNNSVQLPANSSPATGDNGGGVISLAGPGAAVSGSTVRSGSGAQEKKVNEQDNNSDVVFSYNFESGYNGWWTDNGQWEIGAAVSGPKEGCFKSAHCAGTILAGNYSDYIASRLISPAITLPELEESQRILLTFMQWYSLHIHDLVKLQIAEEKSPGEWSDWKTLLVHSGFTRKWKPTTSEVSNYSGKTVRFGFYLYQSLDKAGAKEGWYLDDFVITVR